MDVQGRNSGPEYRAESSAECADVIDLLHALKRRAASSHSPTTVTNTLITSNNKAHPQVTMGSATGSSPHNRQNLTAGDGNFNHAFALDPMNRLDVHVDQSSILQRQIFGQLRDIMELKLKLEKQDKKLARAEATILNQRSEISTFRAAIVAQKAAAAENEDDGESLSKINDLYSNLFSYKSDEIQMIRNLAGGVQTQQLTLRDEVIGYQSALEHFRQQLELQSSVTLYVTKLNETLESDNRAIRAELIQKTSLLGASSSQMDALYENIKSYDMKIKSLMDESRALITALETDTRARHALENLLQESSKKEELTAEMLLKSEILINEMRECHETICSGFLTRITELEKDVSRASVVLAAPVIISNATSNKNNNVSNDNNNNRVSNNSSNGRNTNKNGMDMENECDKSANITTVSANNSTPNPQMSVKPMLSPGLNSSNSMDSAQYDRDSSVKQSHTFRDQPKQSMSTNQQALNSNELCSKCGETSYGLMIACTTCPCWVHSNCAKQIRGGTYESLASLRTDFQCPRCKQ